jgi:hypothetical protein
MQTNQRAILNFPLGMNLAPRGEICPLEVNISV